MRILVEPLVVVIAAGKRPASIPNLEAKPASADGTAPGRVWESRTPPQHSIQAGGARNTIVPSPTRLLYAGPPAYTTTLSLRANTTQPHTQSLVGAVITATQIPDEPLEHAVVPSKFLSEFRFCIWFFSPRVASSDESHTSCVSTAPYAH